MTLSCTQVSCERSFSKLKIIKSRLRSTIGQPHLEALMLIALEEKNFPIDHDVIIDHLAESSNELKRALLY